MSGQSRFRYVWLLAFASLCLAASDAAAARSATKAERASHVTRTKGTAARPRAKRPQIEAAAPRPLVIRPFIRPFVPTYLPGDYLCPRPGAPAEHCAVVRSQPVELSGPGSSATSLGSSVLQPPRVPPVDDNQPAYNQPAAAGPFRIVPPIGASSFAIVAGRISSPFGVAGPGLPTAPVR